MAKFVKKNLMVLLAIFIAAAFCGCLSNGESEQPVTEHITMAQITTEQPETELPPDTKPKPYTIDELISDMSLEEKVGQMFYVRCPDVEAVETVSKYHLGGYILFGRDFSGKTSEEIISDIQSYQNASVIPMLIGVDEEGGSVVRISDNPNLRGEKFESPKNIYQNGGWGAIDRTEAEKADILLSLGVNVNMAPVCDITSNTESFMYDRSFSDDAQTVSEFVKKNVIICREKKLGTVLKHFPGYGNNVDTHQGMAYDNREYSDFVSTDFLPFKAGVDAGADAILVSHNIVTSMDEEFPASLSEKVHKIIRDELNFDGVIMTDDLVMEAITQYTGADASAVFAAKCGNDVLCCTDVEAQYPAVLKAVQNGEISEEQINKSVRRILKWKENLGLIE